MPADPAGWERRHRPAVGRGGARGGTLGPPPGDPVVAQITTFVLPSVLASQRVAVERVAAALGPTRIGVRRDPLLAAVAEAVANAIVHGNRSEAHRSVTVRVVGDADAVTVQVSDEGPGMSGSPPVPDLAAKLQGDEPLGGWGWYLMCELVDEVRSTTDDDVHTVHLTAHTVA